jgi:hypothetical protein
MNGEEMKYRPQALLGDYLRAACGVLLTGLPMLFVTGSPATLAILGGLTAVFALFGFRTLVRHSTLVVLSPDGVRARGLLGGQIAWRELDQVKLGYYTTRRDRQGGWMQLTLRGKGRRLKFDSSLEGFDGLVRQAVAAARANSLELSDSTMANLASMNIVAPQGAAATGQ